MSSIPFVQEEAPPYGESITLSPLVRRVAAENPGPFTYTGSSTFIIGRNEVAVIDPGPMREAHVDAVMRAVEGERVTQILITHTHSDHSGAAMALRERTGAPVFGFAPHARHDEPSIALEEGADTDLQLDHRLADGDVIDAGDWRLEALHTPGHTSNHLCFALPQEKTLFTGDHIMGWATSVVIPPDGDMGDYMESLEHLANRDDQLYRPTHGAPVENPQDFTRAVIAHRQARDEQILKQLSKGARRIPDMVKGVYIGLDPRLRPAAALSVYAHLIRLVRTGAVKSEGRQAIDGEFTLS